MREKEINKNNRGSATWILLIVVIVVLFSAAFCKYSIDNKKGISQINKERVSNAIFLKKYDKIEILRNRQLEAKAIEDRMNRLNIYAKTIDSSTYYIMVNRVANCVTVYEKDSNGEYTIPVKSFVCSVGLNNATPLGDFTISDKYLWRYLYGNVYGQYAIRIAGSIMFHSVPYESDKASTLEWEEYNKLGEAASLGCVRLSVEDVKWIYNNCPAGTKVTIYDDASNPGPLGKPVAIKIGATSENRFWDPTDLRSDNPWFQEELSPIIYSGGDITIKQCDEVDLLTNVSAVDSYGYDITDKIVISGVVDIYTIGDYLLTYTVTDDYGNTFSTNITVRVEAYSE